MLIICTVFFFFFPFWPCPVAWLSAMKSLDRQGFPVQFLNFQLILGNYYLSLHFGHNQMPQLY